jgi:hypothetical protein
MFKAIASTFANCFKIPELKSRILFTLLLWGFAGCWRGFPRQDWMRLH